MNKKGWLRVVEVFIAILLIASVIIIVIGEKQIDERDLSEKIYKTETSMLREIQLNKTLRDDVLGLSESLLPLEQTDAGFPERIVIRIDRRTPNYLDCITKICKTQDSCYLREYPEKNTYAQAVIITSNLQVYSPRQVKVFCWIK